MRRTSTHACASGEALPLAGVPLAVKDNMCLDGTRTTCGSKILEHWIAPYTATAVARMLDAGAVPIGKTNCDEFAMGSSCENSALGVTRNPYDLARVPGGSSGGSAAAVAAYEAAIGLGQRYRRFDSRAGAFCNLVGFKPTYGRVSRYGLIAFRLEPRSDRAAHAHGRRRGAGVRRDGGLRPDGRDLDRPAGRADRELRCARTCAACASASCASSTPEALGDDLDAIYRAAYPRSGTPRRRARRGVAADRRLRSGDVLPDRAGGVLRRIWRASTACATACASRATTCARCTRRRARPASDRRSSAAS